MSMRLDSMRLYSSPFRFYSEPHTSAQRLFRAWLMTAIRGSSIAMLFTSYHFLFASQRRFSMRCFSVSVRGAANSARLYSMPLQFSAEHRYSVTLHIWALHLSSVSILSMALLFHCPSTPLTAGLIHGKSSQHHFLPFLRDARLRDSVSKHFQAAQFRFDSYSYPCFSPLFLLCSPHSRSVRGYSVATLFFANPYLGRAKHLMAVPLLVLSKLCYSIPSLIAVGDITPPYSRRSRCRCRSAPPTRTFLCRKNATAQARAGFHSRDTRAQPSQDRPSTSRW